MVCRLSTLFSQNLVLSPKYNTEFTLLFTAAETLVMGLHKHFLIDFKISSFIFVGFKSLSP